MLRGHLIEFIGEIEPHKRGSWAKARPLADDNRSSGALYIDRFCARPNAIGLALKSVEELQFSHHSCPLLLPRRADGTHRRERAAGYLLIRS